MVFLTDDGNLRAVWKNKSREQVAVEFQGFGDVQFVFFARRPNTIARSVGQDQASRIAAKVDVEGLRELFQWQRAT